VKALKTLVSSESGVFLLGEPIGKGKTMNTITIDGKDYALDALSENAKAQLVSLRACDQKIQQLQLDLAIAQTARNAYANALKAALPVDLNGVLAGDTLKLN
jgi:phage gp46-like protein